jgi:hypothetical protein
MVERRDRQERERPGLNEAWLLSGPAAPWSAPNSIGSPGPYPMLDARCSMLDAR